MDYAYFPQKIDREKELFSMIGKTDTSAGCISTQFQRCLNTGYKNTATRMIMAPE